MICAHHQGILLHVGRTSAEKSAMNAFLGGSFVTCYIPEIHQIENLNSDPP